MNNHEADSQNYNNLALSKLAVMINFPNCKINLGLRVLSKRTDGFHEVETLLFPIAMFDILEIIPAPDDQFNFRNTGLSISGDRKYNLVVRAYEIMRTQYNIPPVHIHLHKTIPMGAGLGGGSADAAYALKMLNEIFNIKLETEKIEAYARQLGSDCNFFIQNIPALATGKGDHLKPINLDLSGFQIIIIKPEVHIPTVDAYSWITPTDNGLSVKEIIKMPVEKWKNTLVNDFEASVFQHFPEIAGIKTKLYNMGAKYATLTGSGSAVFGLFDKRSNLSLDFPGCFVWQGN